MNILGLGGAIVTTTDGATDGAANDVNGGGRENTICCRLSAV